MLSCSNTLVILPGKIKIAKNQCCIIAVRTVREGGYEFQQLRLCLIDVPVIVRNESRNEIRPMRWGLVPSWAQDPSIGQRMINARAETLLEKPSFKQLVATRRCLVPADGFYEWRREGNRKVPMWFYLKDRKPFAFPGLWDSWLDRDTGTQLYTFTIITTRANALVRRIHDRMPVIYDAAMGCPMA
jgi:putative SOS response-associated peptidase YedK